MDIHHAMIVRNKPGRLYEALTRPPELEIWMGAPVALSRQGSENSQVGDLQEGDGLDFQFDQGQRTLKVEIARLEPGRLAGWRVIQPVWPAGAAGQVIAWSLSPYQNHTLVDFHMGGWPQDDDVYASVSYKWASFLLRLKFYVGDTRDLAALLLIEEKKKAANKPFP